MKKILSLLLAMLMLCSAVPVSGLAEAAAASDQLTLEDLKKLNGDALRIDLQDGLVSFVGGTCTDSKVSSVEDAQKVLASMQTLMSGKAAAHFEPWNVIHDAFGNVYYVFQQTHADNIVLGGAVKVMTDPEGNMLGLTATVVPDLPDEAEAEGITMEQAEAIVLEHEADSPRGTPDLIPGMSSKVVLPVDMVMDIDADEIYTRFVWSVYTTNPSANLSTSSDLPYLAHYVTMAGEYLYSLPTILPGDAAGTSGFDAEYTFQFMEPAEYTGYVDLSDGTEKEITVTLMRDTRTGMYYLGNIEHKIVVADCWEFLYNGGRVIMEYSPDNMEWDQTSLQSLYNYCLAYDYYKEIGWVGADGKETPIIVLKDFCDKDHTPINNAAYATKFYGWQTFLASSINDFSQCLDVCAHEFTHCVTGSLMTYNAYSNDYGAINEAISDIHGNICEMLMGKTEDTTWTLGEHSTDPVRSMSDPNSKGQPGFSWDLYYQPNVKTPTDANDRGGVHTNSSLLNRIAYLLCEEGGMTLEEARAFWFSVDCAMVPSTNYPQLRKLLPWVLKTAHLDAYADCLDKAIETTRLGDAALPTEIDSNRVMLKLELPDTEIFNDGNWTMFVLSIDLETIASRVTSYLQMIEDGDYDSLPEPLKNYTLDYLKKEEERKAKGLLEKIVDFITNKQPTEEEKAAEEKLNADVATWLRKFLREYIFSGNTSAGSDGRTIHLVGKPGYALPCLMYLKTKPGSDTPEKMKLVIHIDNQWFDLDTAISDKPEDSEKTKALFEHLFGGIFTKLADGKGLTEALSEHVFHASAGEMTEIPDTGLESISMESSIPMTESEPPVVHNKKSRPKLPEATSAPETPEATENPS